MVWEVLLSDQVSEWLGSLDEGSYDQVIAAARLLREEGPQLGRPFVDTIRGSRVKNLKELRPGSTGRSELRILFAFDPKRRAILLIAGNKSGQWDSWYRSNIPRAEALFDEYFEGEKR